MAKTMTLIGCEALPGGRWWWVWQDGDRVWGEVRAYVAPGWPLPPGPYQTTCVVMAIDEIEAAAAKLSAAKLAAMVGHGDRDEMPQELIRAVDQIDAARGVLIRAVNLATGRY